MRRQPDHPNVRRAFLCPMCAEGKSVGALTCWSCHNVCELGTPAQRQLREACVDAAEAKERAAA